MQWRPSRVFWVLVLTCAAVGNLLAVWIAPRFLTWYFEPPASFGLSCKEPLQWALTRYQFAQMSGIGLGAVAGVAAFLLWLKNRKGSTGPVVPPRGRL